MSQIIICDVCKKIIKIGEKKYYLAVNETTQEEQDLKYRNNETTFDKMQNLNRQFKNVEVYEICKSCKEILNYLFTLRKKELDDILKEIKSIKTKEEGKE